MASMWQVQAAPPGIGRVYNSDDDTDEPGSPVPPEIDADLIQIPVQHTGPPQVQFSGPVATLFLTSSNGRSWDGYGQRRWYRLGYGPTHVDFTRGPDVTWPIQSHEMDTRFVYQQVQLEVDKVGEHALACRQYREGMINSAQWADEIMKPRALEHEAMICVYICWNSSLELRAMEGPSIFRSKAIIMWGVFRTTGFLWLVRPCQSLFIDTLRVLRQSMDFILAGMWSKGRTVLRLLGPRHVSVQSVKVPHRKTQEQVKQVSEVVNRHLNRASLGVV